MSFIEEAVRAGPDTAMFILQFMPINLVSALLRSLRGFIEDKWVNGSILIYFLAIGNPVGLEVENWKSHKYFLWSR